MNIAVIGSINMDVVNHVEAFPLPGQTIQGLGTSYIPGGKGANQAVAAARAGASVHMVGAVGDDGFGKDLLTSLRHDNINVDQVLIKDGTSGIAFITVNQAGENNIILSSGANGKLTLADVALVKIDTLADAVILQNEIPLEVTYEVIRRAHGSHGARTRIYYNPAPAHEVPAEVLKCIDVLVLNETEASVVLNEQLQTRADYITGAKRLVERGAGTVILTLGGAGVILADAHQLLEQPAFQIEAVDTTAAGDTFIGAFASMYDGTNAPESLKFATAAAAITVSRQGAQTSIPTRSEIEEFTNATNG